MTYRTIVADPPWRYVIGAHSGMRGTAESHYPTMSYAEILALPVAELADVDAHLYLWVTNPLLTEQRTEGISGQHIEFRVGSYKYGVTFDIRWRWE